METLQQTEIVKNLQASGSVLSYDRTSKFLNSPRLNDTEFITAGHEFDSMMGDKSPLARLKGCRANMLLLGVGFDVCAGLPLAKYRANGRKG